MTIHVDENIIGMWFIDYNNGKTNWLAALSHDGPKLKLIYRFRYSKTDDPWDENDVKNWYELSIKSSVETAINKVREVSDALTKKTNGQKWELLRGSSTPDQFLDEWGNLPFCHAKVVKLD